MSKTYRIMGIPFSEKRGLMEEFSRRIEDEQAALTENVPRHSVNILRLGEMIGVSSGPESVLPMLPPKTRAVFRASLPESRARLAAPALVPYPGEGAHSESRRGAPKGRPRRRVRQRMRILVVSENDMFARWVMFCLAAEGHQIHAMTPGSLRLTRLSRFCSGHLPCDRARLKRSDPSLLEPINQYLRRAPGGVARPGGPARVPAPGAGPIAASACGTSFPSPTLP
jgi:hypothetical protein